METIISKHLTAGRLYPRPRIPCAQCGKHLILCWGDKTKPYFRHESNGQSCSTNNTESYFYQLAKSLLANYLRNGGVLEIIPNCQFCQQNSQTYQLSEQMTVTEEWAYSAQAIFDVGCHHATNPNLNFGVEIYHQHRTNHLKARENIAWFEVKAEDILMQLDCAITPLSLVLLDLRNCSNLNCCSRLSIAEIAKQLNIIQVENPYACQARQICDEAIRGKYLRTLIYLENGFKHHESLWRCLLTKKQCVKCYAGTNIAKYKPYCLDCYRVIKNDGNTADIWTDIPVERKNQLRQQLAWLNQVPGNWRVGTACHFCQRDYTDAQINQAYQQYWNPNSNFVQGYVWWFGDKKRCCTVCLQEKLLG